MKKELHELRKHAEKIVREHINFDNYKLQLFIEDTFPDQSTSVEKMQEYVFIWTKPRTEIGVSVSLSPQGDLIDYTVDPALYAEEQASVTTEWNEEDLREIGEKFVRGYYPEALQQCGEPVIDRRIDKTLFTYQQYAEGAPLPRSGIWLAVNQHGFLSEFRYFGIQQEPVLREDLLSPEQVLQNVENKLTMKLHFATQYNSIYQNGDDKLHLVYVCDPYLTAQAAIPQNFEEQQQQEQKAITNLSREACTKWNQFLGDRLRESNATEALFSSKALDWIGVSEEDYEIIREHHTDTDETFVYRLHEDPLIGSNSNISSIHEGKQPYNLNEYMEQHNEQTIKVTFNKQTGQLKSFVYLDKDQGELNLKPRECLDIALDLLERIDPAILPFLRFDNEEECEEYEKEVDNKKASDRVNRDSIHFNFSIYKENVSGFLHHVGIVVSPASGKVRYYTGADLDGDQLKKLATIPAWDAEEAKKYLLASIDPQLAWNIDYDSQSEHIAYLPYYEFVDRISQLPIQMMDAHDGKLWVGYTD